MTCCTDLARSGQSLRTAPGGSEDLSARTDCPCQDAAGVDRLVVEVDGRQGLAHLERVVSLLRGRRHPVAGLASDLRGDLVRVVVWGEGLHGGDDDALVVRRLQRLPGVLAVHVEP